MSPVRFFLATLLVCAAACSADSPKGVPTDAEITESCGHLAQGQCQKQIDCQGSSEALAACVTRATTACVGQTKGEHQNCWRTVVDEVDTCTDRVQDHTCSDWCHTSGGVTLCGVDCFYICPPAEQQPDQPGPLG